MQSKGLSIAALVASILIFIASFLDSAVNGQIAISAISAGGIWYLLPVAGLAGIVISAMVLGGKMQIKIAAFVIGGIVLVLSAWFAQHGSNMIDQYVAMSQEMAKGFNSSFFTGKAPDTSDVPKSSFGIAFYLDLVGAALLLFVGATSKKA